MRKPQPTESCPHCGRLVRVVNPGPGHIRWLAEHRSRPGGARTCSGSQLAVREDRQQFGELLRSQPQVVSEP